MDSRSGLSSIKLMEETDVSVQQYSFLEVTAVHYDEKPEKDGQRSDIVTSRNLLCLTHMFSKCFKPFPSKDNDSVYSETLKHFCEIITAVTM